MDTRAEKLGLTALLNTSRASLEDFRRAENLTFRAQHIYLLIEESRRDNGFPWGEEETMSYINQVTAEPGVVAKPSRFNVRQFARRFLPRL